MGLLSQPKHVNWYGDLALVRVKRQRFNIHYQDKNEKFQTHLTDLRKLSASCEFGAMKDELIRNREMVFASLISLIHIYNKTFEEFE